MRVLAAAAAAFALGCGVRQVPGGGPAAPAHAPGPTPSTLAAAAVDLGPAPPAVIAPDYPRAPDGGIVWSRLPAPHRGGPEPLPAIASVEDARRLVGRRARQTPLALALAWSGSLTGRAAPAVATEAALIAWAQAGDAWRSLAAVAPGDLIVFDRAVGGARASLVAVALGRDPRGVVEVLYLGGGVVRRGFFDPTRPRVTRDRARRVVNTALRHNRDQPPPGTRFLAGELFAGVISTAPR